MKRATALVGAIVCVLACWWLPIVATVLAALRAVFHQK
jgi:hypothetical protein